MLPRHIRRLIYIIFILLFCLTAPILVLYTAGYRYDLKKWAIQKTGSLSVKPWPRDAEIYLDDKLQTGFRPDDTLRITNLLPGKYKITISKDNYYPWEKNLEVVSSTNTFVNQTVLFTKTLPENIINQEIIHAIQSADQQKIACLTIDQLIIINLNNLQTTIIDQVEKNWQIISWSEDNDQILVKDEQDEYLIYNIDKPKQKISLNGIINLPLENVRWDNTTNYLLYGNNQQTFYQINILTKEYRLIHRFAQNNEESYSQDFLLLENSLYYIHYNKEGTFLEKRILNQEEKIVLRLMKLPDSGNFTFHLNPNGTICLFDQKKQKLYLLEENFSKIILEAEAKNFSWLKNNNQLLYYNDFEILIYNLRTKNSELITRYGQIVKKVNSLSKIEYLAFLVNNSLEIIELDNRDKRNVIILANSENIDNFFISPKVKNIYFTGQIGSQKGLFKLGIQK